MKVKIAYTVDDNQVPNEVAKFLTDVKQQLHENGEEINKIIYKLRNVSEISDLNYCLENLHIVRTNLTDADLKLADCVDIVGSYGTYLVGNNEEQESIVDTVENNDEGEAKNDNIDENE